MLTKVGVIYSLSQLVRRGVVTAADPKLAEDSQIDVHKMNLLPGEGWIDIPIDIYSSFSNDNDLDSYLSGIIGEPSSDKCAVVDGNDVIIAVVDADPIIDDHPLGFIIQDDDAQTGLMYDLENAHVIIP